MNVNSVSLCKYDSRFNDFNVLFELAAPLPWEVMAPPWEVEVSQFTFTQVALTWMFVPWQIPGGRVQLCCSSSIELLTSITRMLVGSVLGSSILTCIFRADLANSYFQYF